MAAKFKTDSRGYRKLGKRVTVLQVLAILLFTFQPGFASGGGSGSGGCGSGSGSGSPPPPPPTSQVAAELTTEYTGATTGDISASTLTDTLDGDVYIKGLLSGKGYSDVRLPGYSYFQGLIETRRHITISGQVRIVGGVLGVDGASAVASLYDGAMLTTNPRAFVGAGNLLTGGPAGVKTRIRRWKEIKNP